MSTCKLKHAFDELVSDDPNTALGIHDSLTVDDPTRIYQPDVINAIAQNPDLVNDPDIFDKLMKFEADSYFKFRQGQNSQLLEVLRNTDNLDPLDGSVLADKANEVVLFNRTYQNYKRLIRGEVIPVEDVTKLVPTIPLQNVTSSFFPKYNLTTVDNYLTMNFLQEPDVIEGILHMYTRSMRNKNLFSPSQITFLTYLNKTIETYPSLLKNDNISKMFFEMRLYQLEMTYLNRNAINITNSLDKIGTEFLDLVPFVKSDELKQIYPNSYRLLEARQNLYQDPISYLLKVKDFRAKSVIDNPYLIKIFDEIDLPILDSDAVQITVKDLDKLQQNAQNIFKGKSSIEILSFLFVKYNDVLTDDTSKLIKTYYSFLSKVLLGQNIAPPNDLINKLIQRYGDVFADLNDIDEQLQFIFAYLYSKIKPSYADKNLSRLNTFAKTADALQPKIGNGLLGRKEQLDFFERVANNGKQFSNINRYQLNLGTKVMGLEALEQTDFVELARIIEQADSETILALGTLLTQEQLKAIERVAQKVTRDTNEVAVSLASIGNYRDINVYLERLASRNVNADPRLKNLYNILVVREYINEASGLTDRFVDPTFALEVLGDPAYFDQHFKITRYQFEIKFRNEAIRKRIPNKDVLLSARDIKAYAKQFDIEAYFYFPGVTNPRYSVTVEEFMNVVQRALRDRQFTNAQVIKKYGLQATDLESIRTYWQTVSANLSNVPSKTEILEEIRLILPDIAPLELREKAFFQKLNAVLDFNSLYSGSFTEQGIYGSEKYASNIRKIIQNTDVTIFENMGNNQLFTRIFKNALETNQLQELLDYTKRVNVELHQYFITKYDDPARLAQSTRNINRLEALANKNGALLLSRFKQATSVKEKMKILTLFGVNGKTQNFLLNQISDVADFKSALALSTSLLPNNYFKLVLKPFGDFSAINSAYKVILQSDNKLFLYSNKLESLRRTLRYTWLTSEGTSKVVARLPPINYGIPFSMSEQVISNREYIIFLLTYYGSNIITLDDFFDLLFVFYKQSDVPLDLTTFVNNAIIDLQVYAPRLFEQLGLSNPVQLEKFRLYLSQRFTEILLILKALDPNTRSRNINLVKQTIDNLVIDDEPVDFTTPYELIIKRINNFSSDWEAYLDINPLLSYDNFSLTEYLLTFFATPTIPSLLKYLVILKGLYVIEYKDDFLNVILENKQTITTADASGNTNIQLDTLDLILSRDPSHNFIKKLHTIKDEEDPYFYDAIIYHYLNTTYVDNLTDSQVIEKFRQDILTLFPSSDPDDIENYQPFYERFQRQYFLHPMYLHKKYNTSLEIFNDKYNYITKNVISYENYIITVKNDDIIDIMDFIIKDSTDTIKLINNLNLYQPVLTSLNFDIASLIPLIINRISRKALFIIINYLKDIPFSESLINIYGDRVIDLIFFGIFDPNIYQDLNTLLTDEKIDKIGLYYILLTLSSNEEIPFTKIGIENPLDAIENINLNISLFVTNLRNKIQTRNIQLYSNLSTLDNDWRFVFTVHPVFKLLTGYDMDSIIDIDEKIISETKISITDKNIQGFIDLFIARNIQTPLDLMHFLNGYIFQDTDVIRNVVNALKSLNLLSTFFYSSWINSLRVPEGGHQPYVSKVIASILITEFLEEDDVFDFMDELEDIEKFVKEISQDYKFKKSFAEYKFYKNGTNNSLIANKDGLSVLSSPANKFLSDRPENLNNLLNNINAYTRELIASGNALKIAKTSTTPVDVNQIYLEEFERIKAKQFSDQDGPFQRLSNEEIQNLVDDKNFGDLEAYLRRLSKENNTKLDWWIDSINSRVLATQIILSNFDPAQVLSDAIFEDLLNNSFIPARAEEYGLQLNVTFFPSFWMAYSIMNQLGTRYKQRRDQLVTEPTLKELFVEGVADGTTDLKEIIADFDNIMKNDPKTKEVLLTNSYINTLMFTKYVHNSNPIVFNPEFRASEDSEYRIVVKEGEAKMAAAKGGDGMVLIQKN